MERDPPDSMPMEIRGGEGSRPDRLVCGSGTGQKRASRGLQQYAASWTHVSIVVTNGDKLIEDLEFLADQKNSEPVTLEYLKVNMDRIGTGDLLHPPQISAAEIIAQRVNAHEAAYAHEDRLRAGAASSSQT
jgi:hypothetical protein